MISVNNGEAKVGVSSILRGLYNIPIDDEEARRFHRRSIIKIEISTDIDVLLIALSKKYSSEFALECMEKGLDFFKENINNSDLSVENMMERKDNDDTLL